MKKLSLALAGALVLGIAGTVSAGGEHNHNDGHDDAIQYRQAAFSMVKYNFGPMGDMVKGKIPFDKAVFVRNAENVAALAKMPGAAFIEGTDLGDTEAKSEIWEKRADFDAKMKKFEESAAKLAVVAKSGDEKAIKAQFGETAKTCKSCHDDFKIK